MSLPTRPSTEDLTNLSKLRILTTTASKAKKPEPIADSWEDEANGSDTETEDTNVEDRLEQSKTQDPPDVPPPTPASPTASNIPAASFGPRGEELNTDAYSLLQPSRERGARTPDRRPDKTTSVAARLIAGGLGVRAPKRTEEQREYDKALKEKEKRKREDEKKAKEDEEKAKRSVWED
jgi:hypothetical protein